MILATTETVPGKRVVAVLGLVRGNTIRARSIGRDIAAAFKNVTGGEITDYTKMLAESREQSLDRMIEDAASFGADAIIGVRFTTSSVMQGAAEIMVYGTAVTLTDE